MLMRSCWHVLRQDKEILFFTLLSATVILVFLVILTLQTIFRAALYCYVRNLSTTDGVLPGLAAAVIVPVNQPGQEET